MADKSFLESVREWFPATRVLKQAAGETAKKPSGPTPEDYGKLRKQIEEYQKNRDAAAQAAKPAPKKALEELGKPTPKKVIKPSGSSIVTNPGVVRPRGNSSKY